MNGAERLYYSNPRLGRSEACVVAVEGPQSSPTIVLDRALLFPGGGGQPADCGRVEGVEVAEISEAQGRPAVTLAAALNVQPGSRVHVEVDMARRLDYACQHTAEHLIAASAWRLLGIRSVSVHFGPERSLVDFDAPSMSESDLDTIEDEANRIVAEHAPLRVHLCPPEDLSAFTLRRPPPAGEKDIRIVEIDGFDFTPCCGLHLESTGDLRFIRILGAERYKRMTRVYFIAGGRAASDYRALSRIARETSRLLGTSEASLYQAVEREVARRGAAERALADLRRRNDERDAAAALEEAHALQGSDCHGDPPPLAVRRYADRGAETLLDTAKVFASAGMTALLASLPDLTIQAVAPPNGPDLGKRLTPLLAASSGRGGGGPASFRAVFVDAGSLETFLAAVEAELRR
jgi:alanyl-tRNA synthetase